MEVLQTGDHWKRFLKLSNLFMLIKQESITSQTRVPLIFWWIINSVISNGKSTIHYLFNTSEAISSMSDKKIDENVSKNSNIDCSSISSLPSLSRTYLKIYNVFVTLNLIKTTLAILIFWRYLVDCIPMIVLRKSGAKFSYLLVHFFNMCLKESYFSNCWRVSSVVHV